MTDTLEGVAKEVQGWIDLCKQIDEVDMLDQSALDEVSRGVCVAFGEYLGPASDGRYAMLHPGVPRIASLVDAAITMVEGMGLFMELTQAADRKWHAAVAQTADGAAVPHGEGVFSHSSPALALLGAVSDRARRMSESRLHRLLLALQRQPVSPNHTKWSGKAVNNHKAGGYAGLLGQLNAPYQGNLLGQQAQLANQQQIMRTAHHAYGSVTKAPPGMWEELMGGK